MKRMVCVAGIVGSLLSQAVYAETKTEVIPPEQVGAAPGVKELKLEMTDASVEEILAAFNKMTSVGLALDENSEQRLSGPTMVYDIKIQAGSVPQALDQLGRTLRMGIYNNGNSLRMSPNYQIGYRDQFNNENSEPQGARVTNVYLNRNMNSGDRRNVNLGVGLVVIPGPRGMVGAPQLKLLEATDDQGRSLAKPQQNERSSGRTRNRYNRGVTAQLECPTPVPTKIVKFKAEVSYEEPKTYTRITITEMTDQPVEVEALGRKVQVSLTMQGDTQMVKLRTTRSGNEQLNLMEELQSIRAMTADGIALRCESNSGSSNNEWVESTGRLVPATERRRGSGAGGGGTPPPKVTTIIWECVKDVETVTRTVEAADLVVP